MFTQDEVNKIVSDWLARDRESRANQQQNDEKESALKAREAKLDCREFVKDQDYPEDLLDLLDTSNLESFKKTVEKLADIFGYKRPRFVSPPKFTSSLNSRSLPEGFGFMIAHPVAIVCAPFCVYLQRIAVKGGAAQD